MASFMLGLFVLASLLATTQSASLTAGHQEALQVAIKSAAPGDTITITNSFNISATVVLTKSLHFKSTGYTLTFVGNPPITSYGIRVTGSQDVMVSFDGLIFDGLEFDRRVAGIYIVGKGKAKAGKGPSVIFKNVAVRRFSLLGLGTTPDISSRGAGINANIGSRVGIVHSYIGGNYAGGGGALQSTGYSDVFLCDVTFDGNRVGTETSMNGLPALLPKDVWVGKKSTLVVYNSSSQASVDGDSTSNIIVAQGPLQTCPNFAPSYHYASSQATLVTAIGRADSGDIIVITTSFDISSTIKIEKSLNFISSSCATLAFVGIPPIKSYGIRVFGADTLHVLFENLIFDGLSLERNVAGVYIVGRGKPVVGKGPSVSFVNVVSRRFVAIGQGTKTDVTARGAAIDANIGSKVEVIGSSFTDNYAGAGGAALQLTGLSQGFLCDVLFDKNEVDTSFTVGGHSVESARDIWVGEQSSVTITTTSSAVAVDGNATSRITIHKTSSNICSPHLPLSHPLNLSSKKC
eukprot:jgi/Mesen1/4609/ME000234S03863